MAKEKVKNNNFPCSPALRAMLDDCAAQEDRGFAQMVRILLKEALKARGFNYKGD